MLLIGCKFYINFTKMKAKTFPDLNYLKECFEIDSNYQSGLKWKNRPLEHFKSTHIRNIWIGKNAGKNAGYKMSNGYYYVKINGCIYLNHRIIFAIHNNFIDFDDKQIDHIDNNKLNNNPKNLRLANASQNQHNKGKQKNNTSGEKNIFLVKRNNKYRCTMRYYSKNIHIGIFNTLEEAIAARDLKIKELTGEYYRQ